VTQGAIGRADPGLNGWGATPSAGFQNLALLADRLKLDPKLVEHVNANTASVSQYPQGHS
jgi:hypothetical protein